MPNLSAVEIHTLKTKRDTTKFVCYFICKFTHVKTIKVHQRDTKRWVDAVKKYREGGVSLRVVPSDENPLLLNVIKDAIPTMTEEHAVLLRSFNAFRSNTIRVLQSNSKGKLDCLQQALSLNGILHLQEDDNAIYRINQATWNELMSTYNSQFHSDPFTSSEKEQIAEMAEEFGDACKDGGDLGDVVEEMSSRRSSNMAPNVRRCLNMMRNLAELLNSSWSPKRID